MKFPRHSEEQQLPLATAEQLLSNVFSACSREPGSIPLEALTSYSSYRKERYALQRTLIILMLALFLLLPLLFFAATIHVRLLNPGGSENPVYAVSVDTQIPLRQIEARLNGQTVPLYETLPGSYTFVPRSNGELLISAALVNRQETAERVNICGVDTDAPKLRETEFESDRICLMVEDFGSGVDFSSVTITDPDGLLLSPLAFDPETGCIAIAYPTKTLRVSIPDLRGNVLRVDLKPQK